MEKKTEDLVPKMDDVRARMFDTRDTKFFFGQISYNLQKYDKESKKNFILMALAAGMAMLDTSQNKDWKRIQKYATKQLSSNVPKLGRDNFCNDFIQQLPQICVNPEEHINKVLGEN